MHLVFLFYFRGQREHEMVGNCTVKGLKGSPESCTTAGHAYWRFKFKLYRYMKLN